MDEQSAKSMRLLAAAKSDCEDADGELTLICLLSIRDNVRKEAAQAIKEAASQELKKYREVFPDDDFYSAVESELME